MASGPREEFDNPVMEWVDSRLPIFTLMKKEYGVFPTPKNFNYFWNFGAIASVLLVVMILSGIFLAMNYAAHTDHAFDSVERIMRDVNSGWLIRNIHMNGASFFFIAVYIHMFRGMYYGSFKKPRELLWMMGVVIFLLMMATAFMGYVLPWGQMSYWGATVITNLFSAIPLVGDSIVTLLWGGFSVDNPTLNRFFALHYLLPFLIFAVVFLHVWALHITGSNNPDGVEPKTKKDTIPFHPYYTMKDSYGILVFLIIFSFFVFFAPDYLGHPDNYIPANSLVTPAHIVPEWYFLPFYAMLRAVTFDIGIPFTDITIISAKLGGVIAMFGSIALLFILPFLDTSPVKSSRYRPQYKFFFLLLVAVFVFLGYAGAKSADATLFGISLSRFALLGTAYYYAFFLVILPYLSRHEKTRDVPKSIDAAMTERKKKKKSNALRSVLFALMLCAPVGIAHAAGDAEPAPHQHWHFSGMTGTFDKASMQRGLKVYREVCSACHSLKRVRYGNLVDIGYDENQAKAIASEYTVTDGPNEEGEMFDRPARASDAFVSPYPNDQAAKAMNNGAYPPDLSLITKARHHGPDYVYGILTGYEDAPEGKELMQGQHWNKYMPGHVIAMAAPLSDDIVQYEDDSPQTVEQYAHDVVNFLVWAADPYLEVRKRTGIKVLIFLIAFAFVMYLVKRKVWADLKK